MQDWVYSSVGKVHVLHPSGVSLEGAGEGGGGAGEQVQAIAKRLQITPHKVYPRRMQLPQGLEFGEMRPRYRVNLEARVINLNQHSFGGFVYMSDCF